MRQTRIDNFVAGVLGVHVHQHPVGGGFLAAVAGNCIAIIDVRVILDVELHAVARV